MVKRAYYDLTIRFNLKSHINCHKTDLRKPLFADTTRVSHSAYIIVRRQITRLKIVVNRADKTAKCFNISHYNLKDNKIQ